MIFSQNQIFSDKQAITVTALSDNTIDFGERSTIPFNGAKMQPDMGAGNKIQVGAFVTEDIVGATSVKVVLKGSDTVDAAGVLNGTVVDIAQTVEVPVADLVAGYSFNMDEIPTLTKTRYVQLEYVVGGTATAGTILAGIHAGKDEGHVS